MFKKRQKKIYPPGTFIPTAARVCAIIQLCIAFTVLLWNLSQPFAGDLFRHKSELLLYQDVMGIPSHAATDPIRLERLQRNAKRFAALPKSAQDSVIEGYNQVQLKMQRPFLEKMGRALHIVAFEIPPFELAWLLLSFVLPIMLLKRTEGAVFAVWLLPLLAAFYALDNRLYAPLPSSPEAHLYPTEQTLVERYMHEPLSENIFEQQPQLLHAWKQYLIEEWSQESSSKENDTSSFDLSVEAGEFAFNRMLLENRKLQLLSNPHQQTKEPLWLLAIYLFWNTYFAYSVWKFKNEI